MSMAIEARGLCKTYGAGSTIIRALSGVDFAVSAGEFVTIMGPSGSGKSTMLALLGGLDLPDAGQVVVEGRSLSGMMEAQRAILRRKRIGFVFQSFNLIPVLTAAENVALPLQLAGRHGPAVAVRADQALAAVGLAERNGHRPGELSGGEQQRVAIARALVTEPAIVLADEPTGNLDSRSSTDVLAALRHATDTFGQTVVMITHDPGVAAWSDRVVYLRDGQLISELQLEPLGPGPGELPGVGPARPAPVRTAAILQHYVQTVGGEVA